MTRKIIIPIKCSTVKRIDAILDDVVTWEVVIASILTIISSVRGIVLLSLNTINETRFFREIGYGSSTFGAMLFLTYCMLSFALAGVGLVWVSENFPIIRCIEDNDALSEDIREKDA